VNLPPGTYTARVRDDIDGLARWLNDRNYQVQYLSYRPAGWPVAVIYARAGDDGGTAVDGTVLHWDGRRVTRADTRT